MEITLQMLKEYGEGLIALLALYVALWNLRVQRRHNEKSVTPNLHIDINYTTGTPCRWIIKNYGIGPAIIKSFVVYFGRSKISFPGTKEMDAGLKGIGIDDGVYYFCFDPGDYMKAGSEIELLSINEKLASTKYSDAISEIKWEVEYTCIYGKKFPILLHSK